MSFLVWGIVAVVCFTIFGVVEGYALRHPDRLWTFSAVMAWLGSHFPLTIGLLGIFFGGLMVHFYWHFCPT